MKKQKWALHHFHKLLCNRPKGDWMPPGQAVRGYHDKIDFLSIDQVNNVPCNVIPLFDTVAYLDSPGPEICLACIKMPLCLLSHILKKLSLWEEVRESSPRKHRDNVNQQYFGLEMLSEFRCCDKCSMGRFTEVDGYQNLRRYGV